MDYKTHRGLFFYIFIAISLFCYTESAFAVVLHPDDGEPNLLAWTDRPDPNVVGRYNNNASCVAVSANCIITVRHQGVVVDHNVFFAGEQYKVTSDKWNEPSSADLCVCRIKKSDGTPANLSNFVPLYTSMNEISEVFVIGGYGKGRGSDVWSGGKKVGYTWSGSYNNTLRWGQNKIDGNDIVEVLSYSSHVLRADFDAHGAGGAQPYEAAVAKWDSGGGWFIKDGDTWKVAGLNAYVYDSNQQSIYSPPARIDAVRISPYADWITEKIHIDGDLNSDDRVDFADFAVLGLWWGCETCSQTNNWCDGADFEPSDEHVDWNDIAYMADCWLIGYGY